MSGAIPPELSGWYLRNGPKTSCVLPCGGDPSEASFAPADDRPGGPGRLLSYVYDPATDRSDPVVLDAGDLAAGPVAEIDPRSGCPRDSTVTGCRMVRRSCSVRCRPRPREDRHTPVGLPRSRAAGRPVREATNPESVPGRGGQRRAARCRFGSLGQEVRKYLSEKGIRRSPRQCGVL